MKKSGNQILILLFSILLISCSQTIDSDKEKEYLIREKEILYYKGSPYSGYIVSYFTNGELIFKAEYKDGKLNGKVIGYYENGQIKDKQYFEDGVKNGVWEEYYESGQLMSKRSYKDGEDWTEESFFENGQLSMKRQYKKAILDGEFISYYENGQLGEKSQYENGNLDGEYISYYENGQLAEKRAYLEKLENGEFISYYENGQLKNKSYYRNRIKDGVFENYFDDGRLKIKATFRNGNPESEERRSYWNSDFNYGLYAVELYQNGKKDGLWEGYYETGQIKYTVTWKEDYRNGEYKRYHKNGKVAESGTYIKIEGRFSEVKDGLWESFFEDGRLRSKYVYENGLFLSKELYDFNTGKLIQ